MKRLMSNTGPNGILDTGSL